jgi:uncharacterized protein (DUF1501 family)
MDRAGRRRGRGGGAGKVGSDALAADHGRGNVMLVLGGKVRGGRFCGAPGRESAGRKT